MYDQWSDPEINFDDIVNESFYRNDSGSVSGGKNDNETEQSNDINTCSIITKNKFIYNDEGDNNDSKITITTENSSFEYNNLSTSSSYGFIPYFDAMQRNSMVTSLSTMVWHSKGADSKMYHGINGSNGSNSGGSSHLSGDAIPFVPTTQSKACKSSLIFFFSFFIIVVVIVSSSTLLSYII